MEDVPRFLDVLLQARHGGRVGTGRAHQAARPMASVVRMVCDDLRIPEEGHHHPRRAAVVPCHRCRLWDPVAHLWTIPVAAQCGDSIQALAAATYIRPRPNIWCIA